MIENQGFVLMIYAKLVILARELMNDKGRNQARVNLEVENGYYFFEKFSYEDEER